MSFYPDFYLDFVLTLSCYPGKIRVKWILNLTKRTWTGLKIFLQELTCKDKYFLQKRKKKENAYVAGIFDIVKSLVTGADDRVYLATR